MHFVSGGVCRFMQKIAQLFLAIELFARRKKDSSDLFCTGCAELFLQALCYFLGENGVLDEPWIL